MIARVLVANRGEIAVRVIRACHGLGIEAVVVHSEPDADSMAVELADGAVALAGIDCRRHLPRHRSGRRRRPWSQGATPCIPAMASSPSAPTSPRAVDAASLTWIGPSADVIALMGDKLAARQVAADAGVPPVPGATFAVDDPDAVRQLRRRARLAAGGQGRARRRRPGHARGRRAGRGRRRRWPRPDASRSRRSGGPRCTSSASSPVRATSRCRLVADHHGGLVVVGDRDCSIQRRYQKLIEEAPGPAPARRRPRRARPRRRPGSPEPSATPTPEPSSSSSTSDEFFFLEMNTRIQVEHPVTELVSGVDLVAEQILVADGAAALVRAGGRRAARRRDRGAHQRRGHHRRALPARARDRCAASTCPPGPRARRHRVPRRRRRSHRSTTT